MTPIGTRTRNVSLESGALRACPFPPGHLLYVVQCIYLCIALTLLRSQGHSITYTGIIGSAIGGRGVMALPPKIQIGGPVMYLAPPNF